MPIYPMHFAKTHLSELVARAEAGEEVVLARGREPAARLVAIVQGAKRRQPGRLKGQISIGPEFFEPLPDAELNRFEGEG